MRHFWRSWIGSPLGLVPVALLVMVLVALFIAAQGKSEAPGSSPAAAPDEVASKAVLRTYPCQPGTAELTARQLEQQYTPAMGVRVVPDPRTSQLLVFAPAELQAPIAQRLQGEQAASPAAPASVAAPRSSGRSTGAQDLQLWNISSRDLETALVQTLGERLAPAAGATSTTSTYRLTASNGEGLFIAIDRPNNRVRLEGGSVAVGAALQLIHALDHPKQTGQADVNFFSLGHARKADVSLVAATLASQPETASAGNPPAEGAGAGEGPPPGLEGAGPIPPGGGEAGDEEGFLGPVQIQILDGLDVLVIRGNQRDVRRVTAIIKQIEQLSAETKPTIQIVPLAHVNSVALTGLLRQVYSEVFASRLGSLSITALGKPNALLLIGRPEPVEMAVELIGRLDQPVAPDSQFQIFHLKSIPAETALQNVEAFFNQQQQSTQTQARTLQQSNAQSSSSDSGMLNPRVQVVADFRSNSLIVRANPRELAEVAALLERLDGGVNEAVNQVKVFRLRNSLAETLAPILQDAITGQIYGQQSRRGQFTQQRSGANQRQDFEAKSSRLQFVTVGPRGQQILNSGILTDAQVTADTRTNALVITASPESMPLIAALIDELDRPADAETLVKVFTLVNSDATSTAEMLSQVFGQTNTTEGLAVTTGTAVDQSALIGLRFAVDVRTNSIITTGSSGALVVVEAILARLDGSDVRNRRTTVHRLKNASSKAVADAVTSYLDNERQVTQQQEGLYSAFEQLDREVVVVPEVVTNSLIISATPRYYEEIMKVVQDLDERPPMVAIQVLIAEVALGNTDEFGIELGLQDKVLFDRSVITGSGDTATQSPGFSFNSQSIGNSASSAAMAAASTVGGQSITNLGVGRTNSDLGFGGLVLSASSDSVSLLVRALEQNHRLQVLSRPQVVTMDGTESTILVGQEVPTITQSNLTQYGVQNTVTWKQVGLILVVTPRVSPDGLIVMTIQAVKSKLGAVSDGIPIAITDSGETIRSPIIDTITTNTTVSALEGQTVILAGMIATSSQQLHNKVPYLGDIPVLGHLFRYDYNDENRTELLIIMTPRIINSVQDAETFNRIESARMHWCLCDVMALQDGDGLGKNGPKWFDGDTPVIYPDLDPTMHTMQELVPPGDGMAPLNAPETIGTPLPQASPAAPPQPAPSSQSPSLAPPTDSMPPRQAPSSDGASWPPTSPQYRTEVRVRPQGELPTQTGAHPLRNEVPGQLPHASQQPMGQPAQDTWGQLQPPSPDFRWPSPATAASQATPVGYTAPSGEAPVYPAIPR